MLTPLRIYYVSTQRLFVPTKLYILSSIPTRPQRGNVARFNRTCRKTSIYSFVVQYKQIALDQTHFNSHDAVHARITNEHEQRSLPLTKIITSSSSCTLFFLTTQTITMARTISTNGNKDKGKRPDNNKRPHINVIQTPNKKPFSIRGTPGSASSTGSTASTPSKKKSTVNVIIVEPDTGNDEAFGGAVIVPTGFMVDKHVDIILKKKQAVDPNTRYFIEKTRCIPFVVYARNESGDMMKKLSQGNHYPIKSAFIPLDTNELRNQKVIKKLVYDFSMALHQVLKNTGMPSYYNDRNKNGAGDFPVIKDWDSEVRYVKTFSEAICMETPNDIYGKCLYMTVLLPLKNVGLKWDNWFSSSENSNLYSIFPKGRVDFRWIKDWKVPMGCLDNEDKAAYNAWFDDEEAKKFSIKETDDGEMMTFAKYLDLEEE